jgi:hypothetical protein
VAEAQVVEERVAAGGTRLETAVASAGPASMSPPDSKHLGVRQDGRMTSSPLRITNVWVKLAYVVVWYGFGVVLANVILSGVADAIIVATLLAWDTASLSLGVRIFRGRDEAVAPPRPWWRMTGGARSALVLGSLGVLNAALTLPLYVAAPSPWVLNACWYLVAGVLYLHSGIRTRRARVRTSRI